MINPFTRPGNFSGMICLSQFYEDEHYLASQMTFESRSQVVAIEESTFSGCSSFKSICIPGSGAGDRSHSFTATNRRPSRSEVLPPQIDFASRFIVP
jgi:hypothetical protein